MKTWALFPNGQVEIGNGKPGYDWHPAWSQKHPGGGVSNPMRLSDWRAMAKREGARLVLCRLEIDAALTA